MTIKKPKDKGEVENFIGIVLDLLDRSDEVVVGATERVVVKARVVCRMREEQRGDARDARSARGVPWQQNSAETAEIELVSMTCGASVRLTRKVMETRED